MISEKQFSAKIDSLREILKFIDDFGVSTPLPKALLEHVLLAAEEALVNIMQYSFTDSIKIECSHPEEKPGIKLVIKDQGIPFNPLKHIPPQPISKAIIENQSDDSLGGYGIWLLIKLMDHVEYDRIQNENVLTLVKYASST